MNTRRRLYDAWTALVGTGLALVAPARAGRYVQGRTLYRSYVAGMAEGVDQGFRPRLKSADADIKKGLRLVVARCRDQAQNNSYISGAIERICNNVIRSGIFPEFRFRDQSGALDREANDAWGQLFRRWSRYCDNTGHDSYGFLQKLGLRHMWTDGQFFIRRLYDSSVPGVVPLRLELYEYDQLDVMVDGRLDNGNIARRGIELSPAGKPVAYHFLTSHPGDTYGGGSGRDSIRVDAEDICHVWDRRRISQYMGISWFAAVIMEAYRMDEYRHIEQDGARAAAVFAAFIKSATPGFQLGAGIPAGGQVSPPGSASTGSTDVPTELKSGLIQGLPSGTEVQAFSHNRPGNNFEPFIKDSRRSQSVGTGMSFEAFANDYTDSSYASARSGSLEERLGYRGQQLFIHEKMNWKITAWFIEAAWLANMAPVVMYDYRRDPHRYHEMIEARPPGWQWVDERNATDAARNKLDLVIDTRTSLAAESGKDFNDIVETRIGEERQMQRLYAEMAKTERIRREASGESESATATTH